MSSAIASATAGQKTSAYAIARASFHTHLLRIGPAPQAFPATIPLPSDAEEIPYMSDGLPLKAWVSPAPTDRQRRPAVLFLHGGFAFDGGDWSMSKPYRDAGFVVLMPLLRGEDGLPGAFSMFSNEVDDVLHAADALEALPYVQPGQLYVAGHSIGGTLTMLAAMSSPRFRAAASFSGSPDQFAWTAGRREEIPFDPTDKREFLIRSPLAFPNSFQCSARLYFGSAEPYFAGTTRKLAESAHAGGLDVLAVETPGDHVSHVPASIQSSIEFFRRFEK
jgi:pimeloyl-ACP methyl ester carboxylesterase